MLKEIKGNLTIALQWSMNYMRKAFLLPPLPSSRISALPFWLLPPILGVFLVLDNWNWHKLSRSDSEWFQISNYRVLQEKKTISTYINTTYSYMHTWRFTIILERIVNLFKAKNEKKTIIPNKRILCHKLLSGSVSV